MIPVLVVLFLVAIFLFFRHPQFGKLPRGERLERMRASPNYHNGQFHNQSETPSLAEGANFFSVFGKFLFRKDKRARPSNALPSDKTDLLALSPEEDVLVWFGHSSYFLQLDGKKMLVDPVFSGSASPLLFGTLAFKGTNSYDAADIPEIDYLFITHDHWDHLDYKTVKALRNKIGKVITGLGTGAHLEAWGYSPEMITEMDWNEKVVLDSGFIASAVPARHFSGRSLKRNSVLWTAFVLESPEMTLFLGGDSGYGSHFADIGNRFGPFDLAILENGQYNPDWRYIHLLPEQVLQAARDLRALRLFPVHNSKFSLSLHSWDAPLKNINEMHSEGDPALVFPKIGEKMDLKGDRDFPRWWEEVGE